MFFVELCRTGKNSIKCAIGVFWQIEKGIDCANKGYSEVPVELVFIAWKDRLPSLASHFIKCLG